MRSWLSAASPAAVETFCATAYRPGWTTVVCAQSEVGSAGPGRRGRRGRRR
ncbi:hypothetical protein [Streptomyces bacillaris]|uniref:hypothetical protein n=1 Tax=Streptomyces bacillaris TaxID=68179 RepID=UPI00345F5829